MRSAKHKSQDHKREGGHALAEAATHTYTHTCCSPGPRVYFETLIRRHPSPRSRRPLWDFGVSPPRLPWNDDGAAALVSAGQS